MRAEIIKLRQRIDTTFIYVTHDQTEAMTLGDRIVIMRDGVVQQVGTPQELFDHPANLFVAGFIGVPQMNFFDAKLTKDGDTYKVKVGDATFVPSEAKQKRLAAKGVTPQDVTLGIRPEHVTLTDDAPELVTGTVDVSEMMGSSIHLHLNTLGKDVIVIVQTQDLKEEKRGGFKLGEKVSFTFGGDVIHLFSKADEKNLEF
jgi:multiple sugar transport system ATP-binding protein